MIFVCDISVVLNSHGVPQGQTINKEFYEYFLRHILHPAVCRKGPELLEATPLILQDKAAFHKAGNVQAILTEYKWEVEDLKHPPCLPDLSPCGYDLLTKIKGLLHGIRHDDLDELYAAVNRVVIDINICCLATGILELPKRWESTIGSAGNYTEGM